MHAPIDVQVLVTITIGSIWTQKICKEVWVYAPGNANLLFWH